MDVVPNLLARSRAFAVSARGIPNRSALFFRFSSSASKAASASAVSTGAGGDFAVVSEDGLGASRGCFGAVAGVLPWVVVVVEAGCATFADVATGAVAGAAFVSVWAGLTSVVLCQGRTFPLQECPSRIPPREVPNHLNHLLLWDSWNPPLSVGLRVPLSFLILVMIVLLEAP